jgi:hypothetical protein
MVTAPEVVVLNLVAHSAVYQTFLAANWKWFWRKSPTGLAKFIQDGGVLGTMAKGIAGGVKNLVKPATIRSSRRVITYLKLPLQIT